MVKVKICGITQENEIDFLNELKPNYVGFVFAESKRKIDKVKASRLKSKLFKDIKTVGVFRNNSIDEINDIINQINLDVIQLHGKENISYINTIRNIVKGKIEIWKAVTINEIESIFDLENHLYSYKADNEKIISKKLIDKYLIDGVNPGSGKDYSLSKLYKISDQIKFFLAGGITPENVLDKINTTHPFGIDVSSGVEYINNQGIREKSYIKTKLLINNVQKMN